MPPLTNQLLNHTIHLLPQLPPKPLPNILLQLTYLGLHNRSHHYLVPPTTRPHLGGADGDIIISWDISVNDY